MVSNISCRRCLTLFVLFLILFLKTSDAAGQEYRFGIGLQPSFESGDYGLEDDTDLFYLPLILNFYPSERLRGTILLPWVRQSSDQVISVGGTYSPVSPGNQQSRRGRNSPSSPMMSNEPITSESQSGLGDIVVRGGFDILIEDDRRPALIVEGIIKLPTASESKGMGTGELDGGMTLELGRTIHRSYIYARFGFLIIGEPSGADFDNPYLYEGGVGFQVNSKLYFNLSLEGRTSIDDWVDDPLEAVWSGHYRLRNHLSLSAFLAIGLTDGSPDAALGMGLLQRF
jgi:hypothetical protein